ncbi:MAG: hypothetical protein PVSMB4_17720 [Ktedonobacterales bacterium]
MGSARLAVREGTFTSAARRLRAVLMRLPASRRDVVLLVALGILARGLTAALVRHPGYIDAAYYYAVGRNLAAGRGLTEDFIVTYLTHPQHVTHPSNLYWMPGASLLLVPFFWLFGSAWWVAQVPNVLLTGALPALAYTLGRELRGTRRVALGAGLLTLTSGFFYPLYEPLTDNFGLYAWAAGGALLLLGQGARGKPRRFALAGLCCGVAHLARPEAPLLLAVAGVVWWRARHGAGLPRWHRFALLIRTAREGDGHALGSTSLSPQGATAGGSHPLPGGSLAALLGLYLAVMTPWFLRNLLLVGSPLPPGGLQTAWLRDYNDFFSYQLPLTPSTYLAWGIGSILASKVNALVLNARDLAAVMEFVLAPFALLGAWRLRRDLAALPWILYGVGAYLALSLLFTFPSMRGSLLHSEIAVFPFLNVAAVVGLDAALDWIGRKGGPASVARTAERKRVYLAIAVALSVVLSTFLVLYNAHTLVEAAADYAQAGRVVTADMAAHSDRLASPSAAAGFKGPVVMVADPPNYAVDTGQRAIVLPDQGLSSMVAAAKSYGARYLVLEPVHAAAQDALWSGRQRTPLLTLLYSGPRLRVYRWNW